MFLFIEILHSKWSKYKNQIKSVFLRMFSVRVWKMFLQACSSFSEVMLFLLTFIKKAERGKCDKEVTKRRSRRRVSNFAFVRLSRVNVRFRLWSWRLLHNSETSLVSSLGSSVIVRWSSLICLTVLGRLLNKEFSNLASSARMFSFKQVNFFKCSNLSKIRYQSFGFMCPFLLFKYTVLRFQHF